jgi:hypothetical protein
MEAKPLQQAEDSVYMSSSLCLLSLEQLTENIEKSVFPSLEQDRVELEELFKNIDSMHDSVLPAITQDLFEMERVVDSLETKFHNKIAGPKNGKKYQDWASLFTHFYDSGPAFSHNNNSIKRQEGSNREYRSTDNEKSPSGLAINVHSDTELLMLLTNNRSSLKL